MTRRAELMSEMMLSVLSRATDDEAAAFRETLRLADEAEQMHERDRARVAVYEVDPRD